MKSKFTVYDGSGHIEFEKETTFKIGKVTYHVTSHFDETKEKLPEKIKELLCSEIKKNPYK